MILSFSVYININILIERACTNINIFSVNMQPMIAILKNKLHPNYPKIGLFRWAIITFYRYGSKVYHFNKISKIMKMQKN